MLTASKSTDASDTSKRRAILPSELKKQLKSKRAASSTPQIPATPSVVTRSLPSRQTIVAPLQRQPKFTTDPLISEATSCIKKPLATWSIAKSLTVTTSRNIKTQGSLMDRLDDILDCYRFPFPEIPDDARTKLRKLISSSKDAFERNHFAEIVEAWRKSLLSLYAKFRSQIMNYFYFIQPEFTILFRWVQDRQMEAIMTRVTRTTLNHLKQEGLCLAFGDINDDSHHSSSHLASDIETPSSPIKHSDSDREGDSDHNLPKHKIRREVNRRLQQTRKKTLGRRSAATSIVIIRGEADVHCLVDFLLNQKEGKSWVIMPEMIAPQPFLYGTMSRTEVTIVGPIDGGRYQLKATGTILPPALGRIFDVINQPDDLAFGFHITYDPRSDPLITIPYNDTL